MATGCRRGLHILGYGSPDEVGKFPLTGDGKGSLPRRECIALSLAGATTATNR